MSDISLDCKVSGFYKFEAVNINTGEKRLLSDWNKNLITDAGLDMLGGTADGQFLAACFVGSGSSTPDSADVALDSLIGMTASKSSQTSGNSGASPYYTYKRITYRFSAGVATGNLSEVGVGKTNGTLFSRSLILDSVGNTTTITVLSDEYLDVTYEYRFYAPTLDVTGTISLDGNVYNWTSRACNAGNGDFLVGWGQYFENGTSETFNAAYTTANAAHDGAIGALTSAPSGSSQDLSLPSIGAYVAGSHQISHTLTMSLGQANFTNGIGAIRTHIGLGTYQIGFSPKIPKTSDYVLSLTFTHSWSRM